MAGPAEQSGPDRAGFSETERDIKQLFQTAPFLLVRIGFDGYLKRVNPAWSVLGWTDEELLDRPWASFLIHPEDLARTRGAVGAMMSGTEVVEFEQRLMCKDGTWRWFSCSGRPLPDEGVFYGIGIDITERKRAEAEVVRLNEELGTRATELQATNRELEAFTLSVAHDLRSPLTSILLALDKMRRHGSGSADPRALEAIASIDRSVKRMNQMIEDLLRLSRVTLSPISRVPVDLSVMCADILGRLRRAEPGRRLETRLEADVVAHADEGLSRTLMENLLGNAWKFTGGREKAQIEFGTVPEDDSTAYFVKDNGVGFDPAQAGEMFLPFHRLPNAGDFAGTGVGLSIVQRVVTRHGGRVWAEARPGEGATFYFTL